MSVICGDCGARYAYVHELGAHLERCPAVRRAERAGQSTQRQLAVNTPADDDALEAIDAQGWPPENEEQP